MEEIEVPTEHAQEEIHHHAEHSHDSFSLGVALSSAIIAALAAVSALMAGHHSNEAMIEQIQASDQWGYYQSKGIKASVLATRVSVLEALGKPVDEKDRAKLEDYKKDQSDIEEKAREKEQSSQAHMLRHMTLARAVTMFQVAIAIAAISVLTRRRLFWFVSLGFGALGIGFMVFGLL